VGDEAELHNVAKNDGKNEGDGRPGDLTEALHQSFDDDDHYIESQGDENAIKNKDTAVSGRGDQDALDVEGREEREDGIYQKKHDELEDSGQ